MDSLICQTSIASPAESGVFNLRLPLIFWAAIRGHSLAKYAASLFFAGDWPNLVGILSV